MKIKLLIVALLLPLSVFGQSITDKKQGFEKMRVRGTRVYVEKSKKVKYSKDVPVYKYGKHYVNIFDSDFPYSINAEDFSEEDYKKREIKVIDFKELKIDNYSGKLAILEYSNHKRLELFFGDDDFSVKIYAFIEDSKEGEIEEIEKHLMAIEYEKNLEIDPLELAWFRLDDSKSTFKFSEFGFQKDLNPAFGYTENGKKILKMNWWNQSFIIIRQKHYVGTDADPKSIFEEVDIFSTFTLKVPADSIERKVTNRKKINGFDCYEELITMKDDNKELQILSTVVVNGNRVICIDGFIGSDFETTRLEFEKLTDKLKMEKNF